MKQEEQLVDKTKIDLEPKTIDEIKSNIEYRERRIMQLIPTRLQDEYDEALRQFEHGELQYNYPVINVLSKWQNLINKVNLVPPELLGINSHIRELVMILNVKR